MDKKKKKLLFILVVLFVTVIDQVTKILVVKNFKMDDVMQVIPSLFNLVLTYNKGIAFGLLSSLPDIWRQIIISGATLVAVLMVIYFLKQHYKEDRFAQFAMAMILGGALGNVIDRVYYGQVVDFIDVYYKNWHWPAFNIADTAVCLGVFILLLRPVKQEDEDAEK